MADAPATPPVMEQIVALAKRKGFIYPASDIYGGIRGFWDYGPLGVLLKNNIRDHWWNWMVECPPIGPDGEIVDMVGLDSAIIQHPKTWEASGHVAGFNDPMVDDKETKERFRADHLQAIFFLEPSPEMEIGKSYPVSADAPAADSIPHATVIASGPGEAASEIIANKAVRKLLGIKNVLSNMMVGASLGAPDYVTLWVESSRGNRYVYIRNIGQQFLAHGYEKTPSPYTAKAGALTEPRAFNLMLDTYPGPIRDESNKAYLRPETAQGIFLNFKNIVDTTRVKVPFGVAQIGKSFRNEVTPRNFIFRSREFEQMEMEFFCPPDDALKWYEFWKGERMKWWLSLGVEPSRLRFRDHDADELSHYSKATVDIEYRYPFTDPDYGELEGIAHRGSFDLTQHQEHSKQKLDYFDQELQLKLKEQGATPEEIKQRSRYIPNVIEPASGLTRAVLVLLCEAFTLDASRPSGVYLKFKPKFAPVKLGIFPLVAKDGMPEKARALYMELRTQFACEFDVKQSIGKRYARMDEIGTPFCVTIDGDTMSSDIVTIRDRDTQEQIKINISQVGEYVRERLK
ncbi:MAG: glyQS [Phycisphaerales bacterium]|nr:glyQS [Phycisphaerales bacterium]